MPVNSRVSTVDLLHLGPTVFPTRKPRGMTDTSSGRRPTVSPSRSTSVSTAVLNRKDVPSAQPHLGMVDVGAAVDLGQHGVSLAAGSRCASWRGQAGSRPPTYSALSCTTHAGRRGHCNGVAPERQARQIHDLGANHPRVDGHQQDVLAEADVACSRRGPDRVAPISGCGNDALGDAGIKRFAERPKPLRLASLVGAHRAGRADSGQVVVATVGRRRRCDRGRRRAADRASCRLAMLPTAPRSRACRASISRCRCRSGRIDSLRGAGVSCARSGGRQRIEQHGRRQRSSEHPSRLT